MLSFHYINRIAALLIAITSLCYWYTKSGYWLVIGVLFILAWMCFTIIGSFHIRWNYHISGLHKNKKITQDYIAITFDDGPHPEFTPKILALLREYRAKASFFCIGKHVEAYPEIARQIVNEGHQIGNHSYTHRKDFGFLSSREVKKDITLGNIRIYEAIQKKPLWFRPPFGVTNPHIAKAVKKMDMISAGWSIRSLDTTARTQQQVLQHIIQKIGKGEVILLHDTSAKTVKVLEQLLKTINQKQLHTVTLHQLFNKEAYA